MRNIISVLLCACLVALMGFGAPALAEDEELIVVSCPQEGFSALSNVNYGTGYDDDGFYVYTSPVQSVPYVLINVLDVTNDDWGAFMREELEPAFEKAFGDRFMGYKQFDNYEVGGMRLPAVRFIYKNNGATYYLLRLYEDRGDVTVMYTARFDSSSYEITESTLDCIMRTLQLDADYYTNAAPQPTAEPQPTAGTRRITSQPAGQQRATAAPQPAVTPNPGGKQFQLKAAEAVDIKLTDYSCREFTARLPVGWNIITTGLYSNFSFKVYDPQVPERCIFFQGTPGSFLKSEEAKTYRKNYTDNVTPAFAILNDSPVLATPSIAYYIEHIEDMRAYLNTWFPRHVFVETQDPNVLPDIKDAFVYETMPGMSLGIQDCRDDSINRFICTSLNDKPCEGVAIGQMVEYFAPTYIYGVPDLWFYYGTYFMGFTAPEGELQQLEPILAECLMSIRYTDSYIKEAQAQSDTIYRITMANSAYMERASASLTSAWDERNTSFDILSQKRSDATLGYDRLYDPDTGEIYRAETGFYDQYDLHRGEYSNPNLLIIDSSSEQYYLSGIDYYITSR